MPTSLRRSALSAHRITVTRSDIFDSPQSDSLLLRSRFALEQTLNVSVLYRENRKRCCLLCITVLLSLPRSCARHSPARRVKRNDKDAECVRLFVPCASALRMRRSARIRYESSAARARETYHFRFQSCRYRCRLFLLSERPDPAAQIANA